MSTFLCFVDTSFGHIDAVATERPYCRIGHLVEAGVAKRETASKYLKEIAGVGVLEEQSHGREKIFVNTRFLTLLTTEPMTYPPLKS